MEIGTAVGEGSERGEPLDGFGVLRQQGRHGIGSAVGLKSSAHAFGGAAHSHGAEGL